MRVAAQARLVGISSRRFMQPGNALLMPEISVIIPSYNRVTLLPRAVASVSGQDFDDLEILIIDDGSADNTAEVVAGLSAAEPRICYIVHPHNKGEAAARNTGLRAARGRFIAFLDSDVSWINGKLLCQHQELGERGEDLAAEDLAALVTA